MFILQTIKSLKERFANTNSNWKKNRQYNGQTKRGTSTDNTMAKRKGEQVQTIQWLNEKGNKYRQYNGQAKRGRSTDNTMAKRKGDKTANNNLQSTT
jgi:hypothetical protein